MPAGSLGHRFASGGARVVVYHPSVLLPIATGGSSLLAGAALAVAAGHRMPWTELTYFGAVALIVGGVVVYFLVGLWLIPASMAAGGSILFAANQVLVYLAPWSGDASVPFLLAGGLTTIWGFAHLQSRRVADGAGP